MIVDWKAAGPGRRQGRLDTGGPEEIPVWEVHSGRPGPTLVVTAGVHGCEYVGIQALRVLYRRLEPAALRGRLLLLPLLNARGFYAGAKGVVPEDGKNLNRVFPAPAGGTAAERIAHAVEAALYPQADFLLDLHGGEVNEAMAPLVFFPAQAAPEVTARARAAAACLAVGYRIPSTARDGLYSWAAQRGVPALLQEVGYGGLWTREQVEQVLAGIDSLLGHLGMGGEARPNAAQREALEACYRTAEADGFWEPQVRPGQAVAEGQLLGVLSDLEGRPLQRLTAPWDGVVLYHTVGLGVEAGSPLLALGRFA